MTWACFNVLYSSFSTWTNPMRTLLLISCLTTAVASHIDTYVFVPLIRIKHRTLFHSDELISFSFASFKVIVFKRISMESAFNTNSRLYFSIKKILLRGNVSILKANLYENWVHPKESCHLQYNEIRFDCEFHVTEYGIARDIFCDTLTTQRKAACRIWHLNTFKLRCLALKLFL